MGERAFISSSSMHVIPHIQALKKYPNQEQAKGLLQQLADQVLPIVTKYQWKVKHLVEFTPKDPCLLGMNVNRGAKILIRLRPASNLNRFYPYDHLLGTMLHELVHMRIGPHNDAFYRLLDELRTYAEMLLAKGLSGTTAVAFGDAGEGKILGGSNVHNRHGRRQALAKAASKRKHFHEIQGRLGGQRLGGGDANSQSLDKRQLLLQAAERRRKDDVSCATVEHGIKGILCPGKRKSSTEIIIIDVEDENQEQMSRGHMTRNSWECKLCTFINHTDMKACEMCDTRRHPNVIDLSLDDDTPSSSASPTVPRIDLTVEPKSKKQKVKA